MRKQRLIRRLTEPHLPRPACTSTRRLIAKAVPAARAIAPLPVFNLCPVGLIQLAPSSAATIDQRIQRSACASQPSMTSAVMPDFFIVVKRHLDTFIAASQAGLFHGNCQLGIPYRTGVDMGKARGQTGSVAGMPPPDKPRARQHGWPGPQRWCAALIPVGGHAGLLVAQGAALGFADIGLGRFVAELDKLTL